MSNPSSTPVRHYEIVVGFDFSALSERALEEAFEATTHHSPAEIHVVTVAQPYGTLACLPGDTKPLSEEQARETVRLRVAELAARYQQSRGPIGVDRIAVYLLVATPTANFAKPITDLAKAVDADLIVVGTHGRKGVERALLGSVASEVAKAAECSVYIVNPSDFVHGEKVPDIQPPLEAGQAHLKHFEHRRTFHYVDRVAPWTNRTLPVS